MTTKGAAGQQNDIPISVALLALIGVSFAYFYLTYLRLHPGVMEMALMQMEKNVGLVWLTLISVMVNMAALSLFIKRSVKLERQGSKLAVLEGKSKSLKFKRGAALSLLLAFGSYFVVHSYVIQVVIQEIPGIVMLSNRYYVLEILSSNIAISVGLVSHFIFKGLARMKFSLGDSHKLEKPEIEIGELILGTTPGDIERNQDEDAQETEEWVKIPSRGINGGIFISGSIGSGKTQGTILRYLRQIVRTKSECPAILAVDPKRTFLGEAEKIIRQAGLGDRIVKVSLKGNVSFNPVYIENPLVDSRFTELAEMVRSAAVNFMGKSSDSPFWDVSSSHLIRNAITYCAAKHGYFTLLDLYRTIVRASKENLAEDLKTCVLEGNFNEEEKFNIGRAVEYFENEYSQLEDRVRTGIVATSTAFINQFQEFAASRVFCPSKENLTIKSMEDLIREGKILLFDVNQPGLARSMGTFVKLHFEQAVLNLLPELKQKDMPCTTALIIDEYQDVVTCGGGGTIGDESFMAKARESKPAVIVATQSLSSLMNSVGSQRPALELVQNFRTRIACHSSDLETIKLFQELAGKEDVERKSRSMSETARNAKINLFAGGFDSQDASLNESVSQSLHREDLVTGKEFSRLRTFEAFAQVFDGIETKFLRLYLKPDFLRLINTKHKTVLEMLKATKKGGAIERIKHFAQNLRAVVASLFLAGNVQAAIPNVCTVASSPAFSSCLELNIGGCMCGFPPRPCAAISYYVPQTFIEVWPETRTSYFVGIPGATAQLAKVFPKPFGAEADDDTQSFQARAIAVPLAGLTFQTMPAGGTRMEKLCFDGMSEHFGAHWSTGKGDLLQPSFLAWSAAPKACLLKGAATSVVGDGSGAVRGDSPLCSFPIPKTDLLPPSSHPVCNGWGVFFPRYGTYSGPASMTGALMIASRIKSLSSEVLNSMPSSPDEKWQMIYPQSSSCFREGQNVGILETVKNARETMRLANGKLKGYLFVVWSRTFTCQDLPRAAQAKAASLAIPAACGGVK
ncbi:MAG: type IV secretion system DNA-binding domain-containing protein [Bdellovibrionaceae bacterium]|nr:type IV secretion system DNA-binding domain-containing protein [Pseudobdellovibrionaceae bacterium]